MPVTVPCEVCMRFCSEQQQQLLPERTPRELGSLDDWTCHALCTVCLDGVLDIFPFRPRLLMERELTGRWRALARPKAKRRRSPGQLELN